MPDENPPLSLPHLEKATSSVMAFYNQESFKSCLPCSSKDLSDVCYDRCTKGLKFVTLKLALIRELAQNGQIKENQAVKEANNLMGKETFQRLYPKEEGSSSGTTN